MEQAANVEARMTAPSLAAARLYTKALCNRHAGASYRARPGALVDRHRTASQYQDFRQVGQYDQLTVTIPEHWHPLNAIHFP